MRAKKVIVSLTLIPMCPKKNGFKSVKMQESIATSLLKIILFTKNKPSMLKEENEQLIKCLIFTICFTSIKLSIRLLNK